MPSAKKLVAHECNPTKRIADVFCYSAGVKRATGLVSAFKYMKENSQRALDLLDREARQVCALLDSSLAALVQNDKSKCVRSE